MGATRGKNPPTRAEAPRQLTHKQIVALAGHAYRAMVDAGDDDPPDFCAAEAAYEEAIESWRTGDPDEEGPDRPLLPDADARLLADLQLPFGPQLLAWRQGQDLEMPLVSMRYRQALEDLFGGKANAACAAEKLHLDEETRLRLLEQIGLAFISGTKRLRQLSDGDYSPDLHLAGFPTFDREPQVTIAILFERWKARKKGIVEDSTVRRYAPSINSLAAFHAKKDVRRISQDDIWDWAEHRRDVEGIAPATVNRNDLVAAGSIFTFATTRDGKRLRPDNPVAGVRLVEPKKTRLREPFFRLAEVKAILELARGVQIGGVQKRQAASRRWTPWICAYSGARIQEPCWMRKEHVRQDEETGIWILEFPQTKTSNARIVPIHEALIDEGFLDFVAGAEEGYLFVDDTKPRRGDTRTIQEQRASQIAQWIREHVDLSKGVDPTHGWLHSFVTRATGRIDKRIQNALCGHNERRDVSDGYFTATIAEMKAGLDCFPRYKL